MCVYENMIWYMLRCTRSKPKLFPTNIKIKMKWN